MTCLAPSPMIRAEGLAWPLQTFLDSHGFEQRPDVFECRRLYEGAVEIVDDRLEIRSVAEARQIDWHSVVAVKAGSRACEGCGLSFEPDVDPIYATSLVRNVAGRILRDQCTVFTVNSFEADFCEGCREHGDWEY
ncbi:hypothetical protein [Qipengyuania sp. SM2507]